MLDILLLDHLHPRHPGFLRRHYPMASAPAYRRHVPLHVAEPGAQSVPLTAIAHEVARYGGGR